jgi:predicted Zn-dependent peptidase
MKIFLHRQSGIKILTLGIIVHQGSINENASDNGISHFIEHLVFNKNTSNKKLLGLFGDLQKFGAHYNAETTKESTFYHICGLSKGLEVYLKLMLETIFRNRNYRNTLFDNERKVIDQEYDSYISSFNQIKERTLQALYDETGLGRLILGTKNNINSFTKEDVLSKIKECYNPDNCSMMLIGDFDYLEATNKIDYYFSQLSSETSKKFFEKGNTTPGVYFNPNYNGTNAILSLGYRQYESDVSEPTEIYMKFILNSMCNYVVSKRILYVLREKLGLIYSSSGFCQRNLNFNSLGVHNVFSSANGVKVFEIMFDEFNKLRQYGFEEDEFSILKNNIITARLQEYVNMDDLIYHFSKGIKNNSLYSPENELRVIKNIECAQLNNFLRTFLNPDNLGIACIGKCDIDEMIKVIA